MTALSDKSMLDVKQLENVPLRCLDHFGHFRFSFAFDGNVVYSDNFVSTLKCSIFRRRRIVEYLRGHKKAHLYFCNVVAFKISQDLLERCTGMDNKVHLLRG